MKKKATVLLLAMTILMLHFSIASADIMEKRELLTINEKVQTRLCLGEHHCYEFRPTETQFYRFEFENQSIESRLNVGFADSLLNFFIGKMTVTVYDEYEKELARKDIRCGYDGSISLKLEGHARYYIYVDSAIEGNYNAVVKKLADFGGDTWESAGTISFSDSVTAAIDAPNEEDWYRFETDSEASFLEIKLENLSGGYKTFELYEYVPGAGELPLKRLDISSLYSGGRTSLNVPLKTNSAYYYSVKSSAEGGYVINLHQRVDSLSGERQGAYEIEVGEKYISSYDGRGDVDWVKFTTSAKDAHYEIVVDYLGERRSSKVMLFDVNGAKIDEQIWLSQKSTITAKLEPKKTYYLSMACDEITNYSFEVKEKSDAVPDTKEEAKELKYGEHPCSLETSTDIDWYKMDLKKGTELDFSLLNESGTHKRIELFTERDMNLYTTNIYSTGTAKKHLAIESDGTYYIKISGSEGNYTLSVGSVAEESVGAPADIPKHGRMVFTIGEKEVNVFGKKEMNDVAPLLRNGRTMLPARFVAEKLGATVGWHPEEEKVVIKSATVEIILFINSSAAYVNDEKVLLDSPAFVENGRTYTPVRFVAERLGATVNWLPETQQVLIVK